MNITFIGNCQTLSLCFYLQQLLKNKNCNIRWISYGEEFNRHLCEWSDKCTNKILHYGDEAIEQIKISDFIIFQEISFGNSHFSNTTKLSQLKKNSCRLIKMPSIYLDYDNYDTSLIELQKRERENKVDIKVSLILEKFKPTNLLLTVNHPSSFLFMEIMKELCVLLNIEFFGEEEYNKFIQNKNYMNLPQ